MMENTFQTPDGMYRGTDLWMLNDKLEDDELRRQIREMRDKGFYSVIARTYNGLKSDYPGEGFMHSMEVIVDEAEKTGLRIALQAGYMPGACPDVPEEHVLRYIKLMPAGTAKDHLLLTAGGTDYVSESAEVVINLFGEKAVRWYIDLAYDRMWARFAPHFGKTIFSVWLDEPRYNPHYMVWTDELPALFKSRWGYDLVPNIPLLYRDEGDYKKVRYHYFTLLQRLMEEAYFKQISAWCRAHNLFFSGHLMSEDYMKVSIANACAAMPYYKYFDMPGIDALLIEHNWTRERVSCERWLEIEERNFTAPLQLSGAAHQAGKANVLCEMNGVTASNLTFRGQKHLFDRYAAMGVNHRCAHALFYSIAGFRKRFYPHHLNYYQPYWPKNGVMMDDIARTAWFVSQGRPVGKTLVLHPLETAYGLYRGLQREEDESLPGTTLPDMPALDGYDARFHRLLMMLVAKHAAFDLGDLNTVAAQGSISAPAALQVGAMRYQTVLMPDLEVLDSQTLALIEAFCRSGGRLIIAGQVPSRLDGIASPGLADRLLALPNAAKVGSLAAALRLLPEDDVRLESGDDISEVILQERVADQQRFLFFCNDDCAARKTLRVSVPGQMAAKRWFAEDGRVEALPAYALGDRTAVQVTIEAGGSFLLTFEPGQPLAAVPAAKPFASLPIEGNWAVETDRPNLLTLEYCRFRLPGGAWSGDYTTNCADNILRNELKYSGEITLKFDFESKAELPGLQLVMEEPELCRVLFNGVPVDTTPKGYHFAKAFVTLDLPAPVKAGMNSIEITRFYEPPVAQKYRLLELFRRPSGVDLESIHILGDFVVEATPEFTLCSTRRFNRSFVLAPRPARIETAGDVTADGFPFYAGGLTLKKTVDVDESLLSGTAALRLEHLYACTAEVYVNGAYCGITGWAPYEVPLSGLRPGPNDIELRLTNTLRNMMGPSHQTVGEWGACSIASWLCDRRDYGLYEQDSESRTDSFILASYGICEPALVMHARP